MTSPSKATRLLQELTARGGSAADELTPLLYGELREVAAGLIRRERIDHTLQPTALVNEAYFKLVDKQAQSFESRSHFLGIAARAMRQVLVDHARAHRGVKRGDGWLRVTLSDAPSSQGLSPEELLSLNDALDALGQRDPRLARIVELRSFAGLTIRETSAVVGVSHTTVEQDWSLARAWLARELSRGES